MKTIFFDMDGVLVEFNSALRHIDDETIRRYEGHYQDIPGFFALMDPMPGAIEAVKKLSQHYEVFILSTAPWKNPSSWSDKRIWVEKFFGDIFFKRIILTHRKDLVMGDYLIDDLGKNGTSSFKGEWIHFGSDQFPNWESVVPYLLKKDGFLPDCK